jgi:heme O synthase-like polyprenyltransferase
VTILIEVALAALLLLGSALIFNEILDLDAPAQVTSRRTRPTPRQGSRSLKKAA